jgi:3-oxoadipate enol-lactonase
VIETLESTALQLGDHETDVTIRGTGPPVLLIHAIGLDQRMWEKVVPTLSRGTTVITYDLRGHGHARHAPAVSSIAQLAGDAAAVLDSVGLGPAHVVGLSLGGAVAQELTLRDPLLVTELTLCATLCQGQAVARERAERAEQEGISPQIEPTLERWFTPGFLVTSDFVVRYVRTQLAAMDLVSWAATWRALADFDTRDRLGTIAIPTRVIVGELDVSTPVSVARVIADLIPDATLDVVAGAPHMLSLECPTELAAAVAGR